MFPHTSQGFSTCVDIFKKLKRLGEISVEEGRGGKGREERG
jgi:hypothetical protein